MRRCLSLICVAILTVVFSDRVQANAEVEVRFEDVPANQQFLNPDLPAVFATEGVSVVLTKSNDQSYAEIGTENRAQSSGNELRLWNGTRAEIDLGAASNEGDFFFADLDGANYVEINGVSLSLAVLRSSFAGRIGGVDYVAAPMGTPCFVMLNGPIQTLAFWGADLAVDEIHLVLVPEPSSIALLLGVAVLVLGRRRPGRSRTA
ncbi:MAG: PEP-CTERM sorting domain-containing protein [Pirellulales bacterium]|nr:PEP-CTERM sorting domain-containing protein [Pirellulales bacterium]